MASDYEGRDHRVPEDSRGSGINYELARVNEAMVKLDEVVAYLGQKLEPIFIEKAETGMAVSPGPTEGGIDHNKNSLITVALQDHNYRLGRLISQVARMSAEVDI